MKVTNRFKGLDLIDRVPKNYGQRFVILYRRPLYRIPLYGIKPSPRKRNAKRQND